MAEENLKHYGFVVASKYRRNIMIALFEHARTPSQLASKLHLNIAHVSRSLSELEEEKLVKCINPEAIKGKVFTLTEKGRSVVGLLQNE